MIELNLKDTEFEYTYIDHIRNISRAIAINDDMKVCLLIVNRNDMFGNNRYYETPGGGIEDGETPEEAVIREIDEEIGYNSKIVAKLGVINDYYNALHRNNINNYFLLKLTEKTEIHRVSKGDSLIEAIEFIDIDEAIDAYRSYNDHGLLKLIKNRELPILMEAKKYIDEMKENDKWHTSRNSQDLSNTK